MALLEAGAVTLILAFILLAGHAGSLSFAKFAAAAAAMPRVEQLFVGPCCCSSGSARSSVCCHSTNGSPAPIGAGSGATGAFFSGVVLNAAFFGLSRGLVQWLPVDDALPVSIAGIVIVAIAVVSAILTALYAFQQEGWREP